MSEPRSAQKKSLKRSSISNRIRLYFGLLIVLTVAAVELINLYGIPSLGVMGVYRNYEFTMLEKFKFVSSQKRNQLLRWIEERRDNADVIAESHIMQMALQRYLNLQEKTLQGGQGSQLLQNKLQRALDEHLHLVAETYGVYDTILLLDRKDFTIFSSTNSLDINQSIQTRYSLNEDANISEDNALDVVRDTDGELLLVFSRSIVVPSAEAGKARDLWLILVVRTDEIIKPMLDLEGSLGRTGEVVLVNSDQYTLTSLNYIDGNGIKPTALNYRIEAAPARLAAQGREGSIRTQDYRGENVLAFYRHIPISTSVQWGMVLKQDINEVMQPLWQGIYRDISGWLMAIIIMLVATTYIAGRIARPIREVGLAAQKVMSGDFEVAVDSHKNNPGEVDLLIQAFNRMVKRVRNRTSLLEDSNARLEELSKDLHAREEQFRTLITNIPGVSYRVELKENWLMTFVSDAIEELSGIPAEEFLNGNKIYLDIVHEDDRYERDQAIDKAVASGDIFNAEYRIVSADGREKWVRERGQAIRDENHTINMIDGAVFEVTDIKKAQINLQIAKNLADEANSAKSDFLANMSHEIRTPMNAIIGLSHLALKTSLTAKQKDYLKKISGSSEALLGIINDILDFSKIEAGKLHLEFIDFDLLDVLEQTTHLVGGKAQEKGLEFIYDYPSDLVAQVNGDPLRLRQIITNLISNAVKFTDQGQITLRISTSLEIDETFYRFEVIDTGVGLSEEQQAKLFQAFSQADTSITRKFGGTGLGLAISKQLVEMLGGHIGVNSQLHEGSCFYFTVPLKPASELLKPKLSRPDNLKTLRALVVDDNQTSREIITRHLAQFGIESDEVASGEEAVSEFKASKEPNLYQLVFMDWKMKGMDGLSAAQEIQSLASVEQTKIIMVSAYGNEELLNKARAIGITDYLVKPVSESTLLDAIVKAVHGSASTVTPVSDGSHGVVIAPQTFGAQLLLVEDNEINRQVAHELLSSEGFKVDEAINGREAIAMLEARDYDCVLMDLQMPVMDGLSATRAIRQQEQFKQLPIIAMTANAMAGDKEASLAAGMNDHIAKPIDVAQLFKCLNQWVVAAKSNDISRGQVKYKANEGGGGDLSLLTEFNVPDALARMAGNEVLFVKMLNMFSNSHEHTLKDIQQAVDAGDRSAVAHIAHGVKGVASNLSAESLAGAAADLEQCARDSDSPLATELLALEVQLQAVLVDIERFQVKVTVPACAEITHLDDLAEKLITLRELLQQSDTQALEVVAQLVDSGIEESIKDRVQSLASAVNSYDFERAQRELEGLLEQLKS